MSTQCKRVTDEELLGLIYRTEMSSRALNAYGFFDLPSVCQELLTLRANLRMNRQVDEACRELEQREHDSDPEPFI